MAYLLDTQLLTWILEDNKNIPSSDEYRDPFDRLLLVASKAKNFPIH
jgi:PIN domain nuclease of toxin-antitoxin system